MNDFSRLNGSISFGRIVNVVGRGSAGNPASLSALAFSRLVASWARYLWGFISSNSHCISSMEDRGGFVVPESGVFSTVSDSLFPEELPLTIAEVARRGVRVSSDSY